jgi:hypothetical protein
MDWIISQYSRFCSWYAAGGDGPYQLWLYSGLAALCLCLICAYYLMRRLLGHRKFRGTWYNEQQWQELIKMTFEDQQKGSRVLRYDEVKLLRKWELGHSKGFGRDSGWGL